MGQILTSPKNDMEQDLPEFTQEERELLDRVCEIIDCFFRCPTIDNYQVIRSNDSILRRRLGKGYDMFVLAARDKYTSLEGVLNNEEKNTLRNEINRLLSNDTLLTPEDLDTMWILYYATGEKKYPDKVASIVGDTSQQEVVRLAAKWSHDSHHRQGKLA